MKNTFFIIIILICFKSLNASLILDNTKSFLPKSYSIEDFFRALKNKDSVILENIRISPPSWDKNNLSSQLINVFIGNPLQKKESEPIKKDFERILINLIDGYEVLNNPSKGKLKAYQKFSQAIQLSNDNDFNEALKFSLISMLNLLKREIFLDNKKFTPYLEHYKEVQSDASDELIIALFEITLKSKESTDFKSKAESQKSIQRLDSMFANLKESNLLKVEYYYTKGIQAKLNRDFNEALYYIHKVNKGVNRQFQKELYATTIWQLSSILYLKKNSDSALFYLKKSQKLSRHYREDYYDERLASWIFSQRKQYDSAYFYLDKSIKSEYKWDAKKNSLESGLLAVENQTEKLKLDKLRLDNRRKTNQNYLIVTLSLLVIGTITAVFLQKNTTKKRLLAEQEALLKQERVDNLLKEQELVSIDAMIEGQEKERQRVANELHDDLGSLMATIKLHFDNSKVSKKDPGLQNAQKLLEEAYQKVRGMAHSKNSGVMSDQGLLPAIKKMGQVITETNALEVVVEDFGMGDRLENSLELNLFRMVQELVANTIKHAEASKVSIQLTQHEDNLNIIIEDNGKGFDRSKVDTSKTGMGLTTIEKRVEHLEGNFTVDSILGKGTSILIDIPV